MASLGNSVDAVDAVAALAETVDALASLGNSVDAVDAAVTQWMPGFR